MLRSAAVLGPWRSSTTASSPLSRGPVRTSLLAWRGCEGETSGLRRDCRRFSNPSSKKTGRFDVIVFEKNGSFSEKCMSKHELLIETKLNARDLIHLDSGYHRRPRPVLLIRSASFVLAMSAIRAIISKDAVYLFHTKSVKIQRFAPKLSEFLQGRRLPFLPKVSLGADFPVDLEAEINEDTKEKDGASSKQLDFELRALEGVLSHVCRIYHNRTMLLSPLAKNMLNTLSLKPVEPEILHQLLPMKDSLSQFEIETTLARDILAELIHNEEDMISMLLTETSENGGKRPPRESHTKVELLLENYCSQLVDISQEAYYLRKRVESTQSIIELKLDTHRNHMLKINIQIAIGSMALALGTTISGLFGANLLNGLEEHPTAFYWLGIFSAASIFSLYTVLQRHVEASIPRTLEGQKFDSIFQHLSEIQLIIGVARSRRKTRAQDLSKSELAMLLRKIAGVNINDEDFEIIWRTFDLDHDGFLAPDEIHDALRRSPESDRELRLKEFIEMDSKDSKRKQ